MKYCARKLNRSSDLNRCSHGLKNKAVKGLLMLTMAAAMPLTMTSQAHAATSNITCSNPNGTRATGNLAQGAPNDIVNISGIQDYSVIIATTQESGNSRSKASGTRFTHSGSAGVTPTAGWSSGNTLNHAVRRRTYGVNPGGNARFSMNITGNGAPRRQSWTVTCFAPSITADDETLAAPLNTATAQPAILNVLPGDLLSGVQVSEAAVTLSQQGTWPAGFSLNQDGTVDVTANTPNGTFMFDYRICEDGKTPANCAVATIEIPVYTPNADLSITKTNTPGINNEIDQAADTLAPGSNATYTIVVTNNGPDTVTGALVTDNPVSGLTCAGTDPVSITGDGVPSGTYTISDLTGAGIALGTLTNGATTVLSLTCEVG